MEGYFVEPRYTAEGLGPAQSNVLGIVDFPWETLPSLGIEWRWDGKEGGRSRRKEGSRNWNWYVK